MLSTQSTAGAIPIRNEKGEISMQKVKVQRYVSGKIPDYARKVSSDESSGDEDFIENRKANRSKNDEKQALDDKESSSEPEQVDDPRLQRLKAFVGRREPERHQRRHVPSPKRAVSSSSSSASEDEEEAPKRHYESGDDEQRTRRFSICSESESQSDVSDSENERRRQKLKDEILKKQQVRVEEELLQREEENKSEPSSEESSEYDESESDEENEPRIKPQFVRKNDRSTIIEKERDLLKQKQVQEQEARRQAKDRRRYTLKIVEESIKKDLESQKKEKDPHINDVKTDDENDEIEYEAWKLRELKRIKRERDEREEREKEKDEIERLRNLTEEERRKELQQNPKEVTNKTSKGKYKFLQKYYHRGAFYLDKEETVLKQDFSEPTLEDHFDKTILPKVMQVKNFGRCGRTKYTHLVDQDTSKFDSPWLQESSTNINFINSKAAGMKQIFNRPSYSKNNRKAE